METYNIDNFATCECCGGLVDFHDVFVVEEGDYHYYYCPECYEKLYGRYER